MSHPAEPPSQVVPRTRSWLRLGLMIGALLLIGEQFPFSYLPMYSSFDPRADYYYVTNAGGEPYACVARFGTSTANVKKMYRARLRALVGRRGAEEDDATPAERERVGEEMIAYLRKLGAEAGAAVPDGVVVLRRVVLTRDARDGVRREDTVVAKE